MKTKAKSFYAKISSLFVMLAMAFSMIVPALSGAIVMARNAKTSEIITVESLPSEGTINQPLTIHKAKKGGVYSDDVSITIYDKNDNSVVCGSGSPIGAFKGTVSANANDYVLTPNEAGYYKVVYEYLPADSGVSTFTREFVINVSAETASFEEIPNQYFKVVSGGDNWAQNDSVVYPIIPSEMNDSQDFVYYVPVLKVLDKNKNVVDGADVKVEIKAPGDKYILGESAAYQATNSKTLTVKVNGEGSDVTAYAFKPISGVHGIYTITYSYSVPGGKTIYSTETFYVGPQSSFNPKTDLEFTSATFASSFPERITLDTTVSLPKVNVVITNTKSGETNKTKFFTDVKVWKNETGSDEVVSVKDFSFYADWKADYFVTYTIIDAFGNKHELAKKAVLKANVADTKKPEAKVVEAYIVDANGNLNQDKDTLVDATNTIPSKFYQTATPNFIYYHNGESYVDANGNVVEEKTDGTLTKLGNYLFTGEEHNKRYEFKYIITAPGMKEPLEISGEDYTILVSDSIAPTIEVEGGYKENTEIPMDLVETTPGSGTYLDIQFPYFTVNDADVKAENKTVQITDQNGTEIKHSLSSDKKSIVFNPTKAGKYTVEYKAVDDNGLTSTQKYILAVGDCVKPLITIGKVNMFETQKLGGVVTIDVSANGIGVTDARSELKNFGTSANPRYFNLVITAPSGKQTNYSELKENKFTFEESGKYVFTYTAEDMAGNVAKPRVIEVNVLANEATTNTKESGKVSKIVWPIVIIVLSLGVLGFVVWFFLAEHKKKNKDGAEKDKNKKSKKADKSKDKNDNDKIVV